MRVFFAFALVSMLGLPASAAVAPPPEEAERPTDEDGPPAEDDAEPEPEPQAGNGQIPDGEQPTPDSEKPTPDSEKPSPDGEQASPDGEQPSPDGEQPTPGAEDPTPQGEQTTPNDEQPAAPTAEQLLRGRADEIRALLAGTLSTSVDARSLFLLDLNDPTWISDAAVRFTKALQAARIPRSSKKRSRRRATPPDPATLSADEALETALREFLSLDVARRGALFEEHDARRATAEIVAERDAARELAAQRHADQLRAYLTGSLELDIDPTALLRFDLRDTFDETTDAKESVARADLALQRQRFLALSADERDALAKGHAERIAAAEALRKAEEEAIAKAEADARAAAEAEALRAAAADTEKESEVDEALAERERAALERQEASDVLTDAEAQAAKKAAARAAAEEAARQADTEAKRTLAQEQARLLGIQEAQANHEAARARRRVMRAEDHDRVLEWGLKVGVLVESPKFESEIAAEADPMYQDIRKELDALRDHLQEDLRRLRNAGESVPGVGTPLDAELPSNVDRGDIPALRGEVARKEAELRESEATLTWELATSARDDLVALNASRLRLLELASPGLRRDVTSFGAGGVDQVKREFKQISLELAYFLASLSRHRSHFFDELVNSTVAVFIALLKLAAVIAAFVWWRRRGSELLDKLERALRERRPMSRGLKAAISGLWYARRIKRPLVMLAVVWGLLYVIAGINWLPSFSLVWVAAVWILGGLAAILLLDAIAHRETLYTASKRDNSTLRIHSLRVVGANVIAVGLLLALSAEMVGRGAIYSWVLSTCWVLSFPVAIYLVHRWKPIIFELVGEIPEQTGFTRWVTAQRTGVSSFLSAASGAVYLLGKGSATWTMRQLSGLEVTRRLLAYLFRRELAKQAAATEADGRYTPVGKKIRKFFDPELVPEPLLEQVAHAQLDSVAKVVAASGRTLTAVIGERGAGKSVFVRRLAASLEEVTVHCVECPEEGVEALFAEFAKIAEAPGSTGEDLAQAVRKLGRCVIVIDDVQRLVVPAVNGLRDLDAFTRFSRDVGGGISWVVTIGSAAWQFIRRARRDRVSFEQVITLPAWSEEQLGELIRGQCAVAQVAPSFEGLVVPRQNEPLPDQGDRTEASYYRLLWDFSRGNPAVAMYAFRESLFRDEHDAVVVRLFKEPSPEEVEGLTLSQLFVLRTVVQLELAVVPEIARATQLPATDIEDIIRFCSARGYIEPFQAGYRMSWPWYRTITTVLQRQHLLSLN